MPIYKFLEMAVDTHRRTLTVGGRLVHVQPLILDLLIFLAQNPNKLLSKDELLDAVWRTRHVSDSVIGRGIMKARRATRRACSTSDFITTLHGRGYRLDADVEVEFETPSTPRTGISETRDTHTSETTVDGHPSNWMSSSTPASRQLVLPCINGTEDPNLDWVTHGLTAMIHYQLSVSSKARLVPIEAAAQWDRLNAWNHSYLAQACKLLRATQGLLCRVRKVGAHHYALDMLLANPPQTIIERSFEGPDLISLVLGLLAFLDGLPDRLATRGTTSFWVEPLLRALDQERRGEPKKALALLDSCALHIKLPSRIKLVKAKLHRELLDLSAAKEIAKSSIIEAQIEGDSECEVDCIAELLRNTVLSGSLEEAEQLYEQGLALVVGGYISDRAASNLLLARAEAEYFGGRIAVAIQTAERAIESARAGGDVYLELFASCVLALALNALPDLARAASILEHAQREARSRHLPRIELSALVVLANVQASTRLYDQAAISARRASTIALELNLIGRLLSSQGTEIAILTLAGRLREAQVCLTHWLQRLDDRRHAPHYSFSAERLQADLNWRSGLREQAISQQLTLLETSRRYGWDTARRISASKLISWALSLGRIDTARTTLPELKGDTEEGRAAQAEASILLFEGKRDEAKAVLRAANTHSTTPSPSMQDISVNLAWILLEEANMSELTPLMASIAGFSPQHQPTALVQAALLYRFGETPDVRDAALQSWRAALALSPTLHGLHSPFSSPSYITNIVKGDASRLNILLTNACD
jgi:DNA-binding winged helix-turn-helix (wHTH) protein/tetratricopeptide (TPR) repeat protein